MAYGRSFSRFKENKRAVDDKYMGPVIKTSMTRCIQCTRCVRFAEEVAGVEDIGAIYRGENMQITSYLERAVNSELSGNVVDLCPVGALTSKPYAFEARPWELTKTLGIDMMDAVGTNVRIDSRGRQVLRVLPRVNDDVNEEWASDKTRHHVDGLIRRRLDRPYIRKDGQLVEASWAEAFDAIRAAKAGASVAAIAGDMADCETMFAAKALVTALGGNLFEGRQTGLDYDVTSLSAVNFNTGIAEAENADVILLVGTNLRWEAPLINTRVRKAVWKKGAKVFGIGPEIDLTYKVEWLGDDASLVAKLPQAALDALKGAERPMLIFGGGALSVPGVHGAALALAKSVNAVKDGWNGFNVVHFSAARMGALMLGYAQPGGIRDVIAAKPKLAFFLGADEVDFAAFAGTLKVYVGHHGDKGAHAADVILPAAAWTEKDFTAVNTEGRVQRSEKAVFAPGDAREDWSIFRALADALGVSVGFDSFAECRAAMIAAVPALGAEGLADYGWSAPKLPAKPEARAIPSPIKDFYLTNAICRASPTMQRCSDELLHGGDYAEAAE
jgi:NADH-quinone oxidoreductase subunit G